MKLGSETVEQVLYVVAKGFFRPSDEFTPVILGLFPEDFDHIEFGAVSGEIAEKGVEFFHPPQGNRVIDAMMYSGVIQDDECWKRFGDTRNQIIHERNERFAFDRSDDLLVVESLRCEIEGTQDRNPLMVCRGGLMRLAHGRPSTLH